MFNRLKSEKQISFFMNVARLELKNERGIFRVPVIRSILMKMIYNSNYSVIDANMSDCQMGGRRGKGCRNNIFILYGIIHEVLKSKKKKQLTSWG